MNAAHPAPEFTDEEGAAAFTDIPASTLKTYRSRGGGPTFIKAGTTVRYYYDDLRAWMLARRIEQEFPAPRPSGRTTSK